MSEVQRQPSGYDHKARKEIQAFRDKEQTPVGKALEIATTPLSKGTALLMQKTPVGKITDGVVSLVNDLAAPTVRHQAIQDRFREHGHAVAKPADVRSLTLESVDDVVGNLQTKYIAAMGAEGATLGAGGTLGPGWATAAIVADLLATIGGGLRAVAEYGAYYGFPVTNQLEREFALGLLHASALPGGDEKRAAFAELAIVAKKTAQKKTWDELGKHGSVKAIRKLADQLGIRLTKRKLATYVPFAGAAVGGAFNTAYAHQVTTTAFHAYRARFLNDQYGDEFIDA